MTRLRKRLVGVTAGGLVALALLAWSVWPAGAAVTTQAGWGARLTCTADASGFCTVAHPAGVVPDAVVVTPVLPAIVSVDSVTATSFRVRFCRAVSSSGACTPLTGSRTFYVHVDWVPGGPSPAPSTSDSGPSSSATASPEPSPSLSPTASASPSPSGGPAPAFPGASNTGVPAGTALTVVNGDQTYGTAGQLVDARDINGCVTVTAPGVRITRTRIRCAGFEVVQHGDRGVKDVAPTGCTAGCAWQPLVITDSEIVCTSGTGGTAVGDTNLSLDRVNIHGCENGGDNDQFVLVQNSWIHDLLGGVGHTDGEQMAHYLNGCPTTACEVSHARQVQFIHNTIEAINGTSAIISNPSGDEDVTIRGNLLTGGAYTLYCPYQGAGGPGWSATDNRFIRTAGRPNGGAFGPWTGCEDAADAARATGNIWDDTGAPLT